MGKRRTLTRACGAVYTVGSWGSILTGILGESADLKLNDSDEMKKTGVNNGPFKIYTAKSNGIENTV